MSGDEGDKNEKTDLPNDPSKQDSSSSSTTGTPPSILNGNITGPTVTPVQLNQPPLVPPGNGNPVVENQQNPAANAQTNMATKIELPAWTGTQVETWLEIVEHAFEAHGCTDPKLKFGKIIAKIPVDTMLSIDPAYKDKPIEERYEALTDAIKTRFAATEKSKINELLSQCVLGTKKPTHLLQEMRNKAGKNANDAMLESLWMQRLPQHIKGIVAAAVSSTIDVKAKIADEVMDSCPMVNSIASIDTASCSSQGNPTYLPTGGPLPPSCANESAILASLQTLQQQISELKLNQSARNNNSNNSNSNNGGGGRSRSRSRSRFRNGNNSGNQEQQQQGGSTQQEEDDDICWYHHTFGDKAKKCHITFCKWKPGNALSH